MKVTEDVRQQILDRVEDGGDAALAAVLKRAFDILHTRAKLLSCELTPAVSTPPGWGDKVPYIGTIKVWSVPDKLYTMRKVEDSLTGTYAWKSLAAVRQHQMNHALAINGILDEIERDRAKETS